MPTYAYACTTCEHRFEVQQSFSDQALTRCPECEGRLRKLFNTVGIVFKGSGFYRTDSRSDARTAGGSGSGKGSDGAASDGSKGSSKSTPSTSEGSKGSAGASTGSSSSTKASRSGGSGSDGSGSRATSSVGGSAA